MHPFSLLLAATVAYGQTLNAVAHEDDSLLFLSPDLLHDIESGRSVRSIFLTAGDAGLGTTYWEDRQAGTMAAYAEMSGAANSWTESDAGIAGFNLPLFTLVDNPAISLVFMQLPDGGEGGDGFGFGSLQQLWQGTISTLQSFGGSVYSKTDLVDVLGQLVTGFAPDRINTQDFVHSYGDGDHSDHYTAAYFMKDAVSVSGVGATLAGYYGYPVSNFPPNVFGDDLLRKQAAFYTYGAHDPVTCDSDASCAGQVYADWLQRQYIVEEIGGPDGQVIESETVMEMRTATETVTDCSTSPGAVTEVAPTEAVTSSPVIPVIPTITPAASPSPSETPLIFTGGSVPNSIVSGGLSLFAGLLACLVVL